MCAITEQVAHFVPDTFSAFLQTPFWWMTSTLYSSLMAATISFRLVDQ